MRQIKNKFDPISTFSTGYGVDIIRRLYNGVKNLEIKKIAEIELYFSCYELYNGNDHIEVDGVFNFMKENKIIKDYSSNTEEGDTFDIDGDFDGMEYFEKYCCKVIPEKVIEYAKDLSIVPKYTLKFGKKNEKEAVILNDKYVLTCPHYDSVPRNLFEVIHKNPRQKLTKSFIEKEISKDRKEEFVFPRKLIGVLIDLGFKKELKKIFFPYTSDQAIYFRNDVYDSELKNSSLDLKVLKAQLSKLKVYRNSKK